MNGRTAWTCRPSAGIMGWNDTVVGMEMNDAGPLLTMAVEAKASAGAELVVALGPTIRKESSSSNASLSTEEAGRTGCWWTKKPRSCSTNRWKGFCCQPIARVMSSTAWRGRERQREIVCDTGMATGAAMYHLAPGFSRILTVTMPLRREQLELTGSGRPRQDEDWAMALEGSARLRLPDARLVFLYDAAVRTLVLLSGQDVFPGPYTYRRFWFRDACLMLHSLLAIGLVERCRRSMDFSPSGRRVTAISIPRRESGIPTARCCGSMSVSGSCREKRWMTNSCPSSEKGPTGS